MNKELLLINGPNLNMLGTRKKEIYGSKTLDDVEQEVSARAEEYGFTVECFQSNHEGAIIDLIHANVRSVAGIIINPGAFAHTSIAIRDALEIFDGPIIEVHISNVYKREKFRHHSYVKDVADDEVVGKGTDGYLLAVKMLVDLLS